MSESNVLQSPFNSEQKSLIKGISNDIFNQADSQKYDLGKIASIYQPQIITKSDLVENGSYPVYGANGVIGYFSRFNHKESQVMITCRGSTCGTVNISVPYSWITGNSMVINVDDYKEIVDKMYLYYYLRTLPLEELISGSGQPQIVRSPLLTLKITLPSLDRQIKIRKIIDVFAIKFEIEKRMLSVLQKQKAFFLQAMFI